MWPFKKKTTVTTVVTTTEPIKPTVTTEDIRQDIKDLKTELINRFDHVDQSDTQLLQQLQQHSSKTLELLQQLLPTVPARTQQLITATANITEKHKEILNVFLHTDVPGDKLTYQEIAEKLKVSEVTIRAYVADLRKLGVPFTRGELPNSKKITIGLAPEYLQQLLTRVS